MTTATKTYEGTKRVYARPMNRGDYNTYRGWEVPADENPADDGYLVEYLDGGKSNHAAHAGYISWSPKDVFERSYKELSASPPADIEANIASEHYFTAAEGCAGRCAMAVQPNGWVQPLGLLTFCVLVLKNGFTVTGESACVSPENFDPEIGRNIARQNAVDKVWPLLGFSLKQKLHEKASPIASHGL